MPILCTKTAFHSLSPISGLVSEMFATSPEVKTFQFQLAEWPLVTVLRTSTAFWKQIKERRNWLIDPISCWAWDACDVKASMSVAISTAKKSEIFNRCLFCFQQPSIAQLVERWTVEVFSEIHRSLVRLRSFRFEGLFSLVDYDAFHVMFSSFFQICS